MAQKAHGTLAASVRQGVVLGLAEGDLPGRCDQIRQPVACHLAEAVCWIDEVVAGVDAPVMFHGEDLAAGLGHHAEVCRLARDDEEALEEILHPMRSRS